MGIEIHLIEKVKKIIDCRCRECGNNHKYEDDGVFHYQFFCSQHIDFIQSEFPELYSEIMYLVILEKEKDLPDTKILELTRQAVQELLSNPLNFGRKYNFSEYGRILEILVDLAEKSNKNGCKIKIKTQD